MDTVLLGEGMDDMAKDIREIGQLMASAALLMAVRKEVASVMRDGFIVTDGRHHEGGEGYDIVVRCSGDDGAVARRLRSHVANVDVDGLAKGVLGIRTARRGRVLAVNGLTQ